MVNQARNVFFIFWKHGISRIFVIWLYISVISVFLSFFTIHFVFYLKFEPGELIERHVRQTIIVYFAKTMLIE